MGLSCQVNRLIKYITFPTSCTGDVLSLRPLHSLHERECCERENHDFAISLLFVFVILCAPFRIVIFPISPKGSNSVQLHLNRCGGEERGKPYSSTVSSH